MPHYFLCFLIPTEWFRNSRNEQLPLQYFSSAVTYTLRNSMMCPAPNKHWKKNCLESFLFMLIFLPARIKEVQIFHQFSRFWYQCVNREGHKIVGVSLKSFELVGYFFSVFLASLFVELYTVLAMIFLTFQTKTNISLCWSETEYNVTIISHCSEVLVWLMRQRMDEQLSRKFCSESFLS
jgi:hypothetical protein